MDSLADRVDLLFGELELALKWDRPAILLAVYQSEYVRAEAEALLAARLQPLGHTLTPCRVTGPEDADVAATMARHPRKDKVVFCVTGLSNAGDAAYHALNVRREDFREYRLRALFWLTEAEARVLPRHAPDFWAFRQRALDFMELPDPERAPDQARELARRDMGDAHRHEDLAAKIALREGLLRDLPDTPEAAAARVVLLNALGRLYREQGDYGKACDRLTAALALAETVYGKEHPKTASVVNDLGLVLHNQGDLAGARANSERALRIAEAAYGLEHPNVAIYINNLGRVLHDQGDLAEARASYERALRVAEAVYGLEHPTVAIYVNNLGLVLKNLGDLAGARASCERALRIDEAAYGPEHPNVAIDVNNMGGVLQDQGDLAGARASFERALRIDEAAYGPEHPTVAIDVNDLGLVLRDLGDLAGARANFERALRIWERSLPAEHPYIKIARENYESVQ